MTSCVWYVYNCNSSLSLQAQVRTQQQPKPIAPPPTGGASAPTMPPSGGGGGLYPSLGDYMGLNLQHYTVSTDTCIYCMTCMLVENKDL